MLPRSIGSVTASTEWHVNYGASAARPTHERGLRSQARKAVQQSDAINAHIRRHDASHSAFEVTSPRGRTFRSVR